VSSDSDQSSPTAPDWATDLEAAVSAAAVVRRAWEAEAQPIDECEQAMTFLFQYVVFLWLSHNDDAKIAWLEAHADRHSIYLERILALYAEAGGDVVEDADAVRAAWRRIGHPGWGDVEEDDEQRGGSEEDAR
jgi:hypothetical protein